MHDVARAAAPRATRRVWSPQLCSIVARASAPMERLVWSCFVPLPDQDAETLSHRRQLWCQSAAGGDEARFATLLQSRGLDDPECTRALSDVRFEPSRPRPRWTDDLARLLDPSSGRSIPSGVRAALSARIGADADAEFALLAPLYSLPWRLLERSVARVTIAVSPGAQADMLLQLRHRWLKVLRPLLHHVTTPTDVLQGHRGPIGATLRSQYFADGTGTLAAWIDCFEAFPVAARQVAVVTRLWWSAVDECLRRLTRDAAHLTSRRPLHAVALTAYRGDSGDSHDGGRAVAILDIDDTQCWVYKPRDLAIAARFQTLLRVLNAHGASPALGERSLLVREHYAWEPFVESAGCAQPAEVARYYQRLGMLARAAELTDASDLTTDNVLAARDEPTLIDAETLVTPRLDPSDGSSAAERLAMRHLDRLPLRSCVITSKVDGAVGRASADIGALSQPTQRIAPFGATGAAVQHFSGNSSTPTLDGTPVDPRAWWGDVESGYLQADRALGAAARSGALQAWSTTLENCRIRVILRDTHVYERLLADSLRPHRLTDGLYRDLSLERVWRAAHRQADVNAAEQDALRDGDTPAFYTRVDRTHLELSDGRRLPGYFASSGMRQLARRIHALCMESDAARQEARRGALGTTLFLLDPRHAPLASRRPAAVPTADVVSMALALATPLFDRGVRGHDGDIAWLSVSYVPQHDRWRLSALPPTLATGTAGLGVLAAALAVQTGAPRWLETARWIGARLADALAAPRGSLAPDVPFHWSWYGTWYALATMADLTACATLHGLARAAHSAPLTTADWRTAAHGRIAQSSRAGRAVTGALYHRADTTCPRPGRGAFPWRAQWPLATLPDDWDLLATIDAGGPPAAAGARLAAAFADERTAVPEWSRSLAWADAALSAGEPLARIRDVLMQLCEEQYLAARPIPWARVADQYHACAFDGRAGMAYALLRLAAPAAIPSLRLVE